jgi:hypothetical protein
MPLTTRALIGLEDDPVRSGGTESTKSRPRTAPHSQDLAQARGDKLDKVPCLPRDDVFGQPALRVNPVSADCQVGQGVDLGSEILHQEIAFFGLRYWVASKPPNSFSLAATHQPESQPATLPAANHSFLAPRPRRIPNSS